MNRSALMLSIAALALLARAPAMAMDIAKGFLVEVTPVANSQSTNVFGINDSGGSGVITGSWTDTNAHEHGYVGPVSGNNYVTFDDPNSPKPGTEPRGINNRGYITGFSNSQSGSLSGYIPFERDTSGNITEITMGGNLLNGLVQGITDRGNRFAGGYINSSQLNVGYLGAGGTFKRGIKLTGLANNGFAARGINKNGDIVGWYYDTSGVQHGFLLSSGTARQLDPPESKLAANALEGINAKGDITGFWTDTAGFMHGYVYSMKTAQFKALKVPGSRSFVQAWGISDKGAVAIGSDAGYYVYYPPGYKFARPLRRHSLYRQTVATGPQLP